mgnify:FL=1
MPWSAFSRAPSRIFYTILLRRFCMLAGIVSEIGCGGDLGIQTVIFCLLESFYYQMHFVFILFAINHKLIAYWAISGFLFFHIKKAVSSNSKSLFLIIVLFTCFSFCNQLISANTLLSFNFFILFSGTYIVNYIKSAE